jgi:SAM-dependent methyltransferase
MGPTDVTLATYQERSKAYLANSARGVGAAVARLLDAVEAQVPGGQILELGSGPGLEADYLERHGLSVDRTDGTPAFVERLQQRGHEARLLDVRTGSFGGPYDGVLANAVLLHLDPEDVERVLIEARSSTRPGGVLALTLKEGDGAQWSDAKLDAPRWFVYWREDPLREMLERAGWRILSLDHIQGRIEPWLHALCA